MTYTKVYNLYCSWLTLRPPPGSSAGLPSSGRGSSGSNGSNGAGPCDAWSAVAAAADGIAAAAGRAQACVHGAVRGPALRAAEDLLQQALDSHLATQLCSCIEDAAAEPDSEEAAAAAVAALQALAALVHCAPRPATSASLLEHFPLAQALSNRVGEGGDRGCDADAALVARVGRLVGEALAAAPGCQGVLRDWVAAADREDTTLLVLQVMQGAGGKGEHGVLQQQRGAMRGGKAAAGVGWGWLRAGTGGYQLGGGGQIEHQQGQAAWA